jgi:large subunit ribosomal protein L19
MNAITAEFLLTKYGKKNPPVLKAGDTVRVHQKVVEGDKTRVQIFEGLVIAVKHGMGLDGSFTVRKIATGGIGVERTYPLHSPNIVKVERTKSAEVSRAKLYYMRDRLGKAARFKKETRDGQVWIESPKIEEELKQLDEIQAAEHETADEVEETVALAEEAMEGAPATEEVTAE